MPDDGNIMAEWNFKSEPLDEVFGQHSEISLKFPLIVVILLGDLRYLELLSANSLSFWSRSPVGRPLVFWVDAPRLPVSFSSPSPPCSCTPYLPLGR